MSILAGAISRSRATLSIMALIVIAGVASRMAMVIEASPNPTVPVVLIILFQEGVSPEDGARLLVRPMERELRTIEGLKEVRSTSREAFSYIVVEFEADQDVEQALLEVRAAVDRGKSELPQEAEEPRVEEVAADSAPTIVLAISGDVQERLIFQTAQLLKRSVEAIPSVLEAEMNGHREEAIDIIVDPAKLEYYGITSAEFNQTIRTNNVLIPAGQLDTGQGRFAVKVPSLIESEADVFRLPIRSDTEGTVTLGDIATIKRTFKDPDQFSSINGVRAITLNIKKRTNANDIEVTKAVRALTYNLERQIPAGISLEYLMDQSDFSIGMINEMQGNILTAMILVMVIIVAALGFRSGILVGAGVPFSLLFAAIILKSIGYSFNFMVLFGMLLALGMLIDGAIVITEYADRKMAEGLSSKEAYIDSVRRMLWPVFASTATTLAAFLPIMFWPGVAGEFMRYLPVTVFAVLIGSLFYALFFAPVLGALFGKNRMQANTKVYLQKIESADPATLEGITGRYAQFLLNIIHHPGVFFAGALLILIGIFVSYSKFSKGVEFFVETEQILGEVSVRAQGNLAIDEARLIVSEVEKRVRNVNGVKVVYAVVKPGDAPKFGARAPEKDQIATMLVETYKPEILGFSTFDIYDEIRRVTKGMPGIFVGAAAMEGGPPVGKPIQIQLTAPDRQLLYREARKLKQRLIDEFEGVRDVTDSTPLPGIEWTMVVDKSRAAQSGVSVLDIGNAVQLVTTGVKVGEYRPDDADDEVDIRVRYPEKQRRISTLDHLSINTTAGVMPASSFVQRMPRPRVDKIQRVDGVEYVKVMADVKSGFIADTLVKDIQAWIEKDRPIDDNVVITFRGANEEQQKSGAFLTIALLLALFLMFILLVTQFNSFYQAGMTMFSVVLSTAGVLLGLLLTQSLFSVIMTGVGIVALAGIVVNNNIVLIDTFNYIRRKRTDLSVKTIAVMAATQRLRPVFLTTITTILGLLPLALGVSVDLVSRSVVVGGVVGSFWVSLASAIVYGLVFSTFLTLVVTPTMLVLPDEFSQFFRHLRRRRNTVTG